MALFITGDTHGDFARFENAVFYEQVGLTKSDCVIVTGDFGGIWDGSMEEQHQLDWLEKKPFTTLFVSGNHDIAGGILEPDDPQFKQKQKQLETSGALYQVNHVSWWKEELPSDEEYVLPYAQIIMLKL